MSVNPRILELIPHRPPFLFVDDIVSESPGALVAKRTWRADEDFYRGHYPGGPITPGVLLCEAVFQTGALCLALNRPAGADVAGVPLLVKINDVRFRQPVHPGDTVTIEVKIAGTMAGFFMMSGSMKSGEKRVMSVDFSVAWKQPGGAP